MGNRRDIDMDGGLFSGQRTADRRAAAPNRTEAAARKPVEAPQPPVEHTPRHTPPAHTPKPRKSALRKAITPIIIILILAAIAFGVLFAVTKLTSSGATGIETSKYQAVFLTNGQIYFGKLTDFSDKYYKLTQVYYVQSQETNQPSTTTDKETDAENAVQNNNYKLIPIVDEIHGPENEMIILKGQVSFFENLRADGKVTQLISQDENEN